MKITVDHAGKTYYGHLGTIDRTTLGFHDRGFVTADLACSWSGGGVSVGGRVLSDHGKGTSYGLDLIMRILKTVGVETWEELTGEHVIVLFTEEHSVGMTPVGIAGVKGEVLILEEHATEWRGQS